MSDDRWKPVRIGRIYCSPACGRECTRAEYEKACSDAAKLATAIGPGWKPRVWENLGWHYEATFGDLMAPYNHQHLLVATPDTIFLNAEKQFVGNMNMARPRASVAKVLRDAENFSRDMIRLVKKVGL